MSLLFAVGIKQSHKFFGRSTKFCVLACQEMIDIGSASTVLDWVGRKGNALIYLVGFLGGGFKLFFLFREDSHFE